MLLNEWSERQGVANGRGPGSARGGIRCEPLRWRSHQTDPPGGSREGAVGETRAQRDALGRISVNMLVAHYFFRLPEGGSSATAAPSPGSTDVVVQAPDLRFTAHWRIHSGPGAPGRGGTTNPLIGGAREYCSVPASRYRPPTPRRESTVRAGREDGRRRLPSSWVVARPNPSSQMGLDDWCRCQRTGAVSPCRWLLNRVSSPVTAPNNPYPSTTRRTQRQRRAPEPAVNAGLFQDRCEGR